MVRYFIACGCNNRNSNEESKGFIVALVAFVERGIATNMAG